MLLFRLVLGGLERVGAECESVAEVLAEALNEEDEDVSLLDGAD